MKKFIISWLFLCLILAISGCSSKNRQPNSSVNSSNLTTYPTATTSQADKSSDLTPAGDAKLMNPTTTASPLATDVPNHSGTKWIGYIGDAKIHATLNISRDNVSGSYYYDKYKKTIKLKGSIDKEMLNYQTISIKEKHSKNWIYGIFKTKNYIEGDWSDGKHTYAMYMLKDGSDLTPPKKPSKKTLKLDGYWSSKDTKYFCTSKITIHALFDDLISYDMFAINGTATGTLVGFGIVNKGIATSVLKYTTEDDENVKFQYSVKNSSLHIASNEYGFSCGAAVTFSPDYIKGTIHLPKATTLDVGIVNTKQQDHLFRKIVGNRYDDFINNTQFVDYDDAILDGENVKTGTSILVGDAGTCYYIISKNYIYAAILVENGAEYYTNNKKYAKRLPGPFSDWYSIGSDTNVVYHYVDCN